VARFLLHYSGEPEKHAELIAQKQRLGHKALRAMDQRLVESEFLASADYTVADVALYAYTHVAEQAGISLHEHPNVQRRVVAWPSGCTARPCDDRRLRAARTSRARSTVR
jgi:glutathione S-transferase